jgi:dienelactone hydrolase
MKKLLLVPVLLSLLSLPAFAEVQTKSITYRDGDTELQGFLAWDDSIQGKRPGVLVVHEWWGLNDYARRRATQLAEMGYVAFALDMYGKGKVTQHPQQASEWASTIRSNTPAWIARAQAGLKVLKSQDLVDTQRLAAIGYCFGGSTVLQLAFAGEDLDAVVSFHGALPVPTEQQAKAVKGSIMVCHGSADAFIPRETIQKFIEALNKGGADWQLIEYGNARHSFTNPDADKAGIEMLKYDAKADQRSWADMQALFNEVLKK